MVSHRTRRREGNGGQRRKRPTAEEEDLPSAPAPLRKGGEFPRDRRRGVVARAEGCQPVDDRATSGGGTTPASRGSGGPRCCACARAKPTRPWKKERSRRFCLPCGFRQCLAEVRGACFSPWCPAGGRLAEAPRLPLNVASAAALLLGPPPKETRRRVLLLLLNPLSIVKALLSLKKKKKKKNSFFGGRGFHSDLNTQRGRGQARKTTTTSWRSKPNRWPRTGLSSRSSATR